MDDVWGEGEKVKIGLIDVDGHNFPNLALMKISAWHKQQGDQIEWVLPMFEYNRVYMSKIFDASSDYETILKTDEVIQGGRAYDKKKVLPEYIEVVYPDYDLYNIKNQAYGYLTRGCPRACDFCDVKNIEGTKSYKVADLKQFWDGQPEIILLDPNTLAAEEREELLGQLIESGAWVDFTQGVDCRFLTEKLVLMLNQIKVKMIHFAWDKPKDSKLIIEKLKLYKEVTTITDIRKLRVYVLTNFGTSIEEDLYRVYTLKQLGYDPYVMVYDKQRFVTKKNRLRPMQELLKHFSIEQIEHFKKVWKMQRQVNNKYIWYSGTLESEQDMMNNIK